MVGDLTKRDIGLQVLAGEGVSIDTTTVNGRLVFAIFAGLTKSERELIVKRTEAALATAPAREPSGGGPFKMIRARLRLAQAAMGKPQTKAAKSGITRQTLYRFVRPKGELRGDGQRPLDRRKANAPRSVRIA